MPNFDIPQQILKLCHSTNVYDAKCTTTKFVFGRERVGGTFLLLIKVAKLSIYAQLGFNVINDINPLGYELESCRRQPG